VTETTLVMGEEDRRRASELSLQKLRPPLKVPGYEREQLLGRGAFGEVWSAVDSNGGYRVAIKYYTRRGKLDWPLLTREVEKLRFLFGDRHVVRLLKVGWDADPPFYVMEYLERGSLEQLLRRREQEGNPPSADEALALFNDILQGLLHAHGKGILHCDLKPANILLDQDDKPRLADFGQSRMTNDHSPALGTLFYMAPEQADLKAVPDVRWDVYALGAILYRMLAGHPPYADERGLAEVQKAGGLEERLERYRTYLQSAPPPRGHRRGDVDRALADVVSRCLAVDPRKRFANLQAVRDALEARALRRARRLPLLLGTVLPLLLLGVTFLFGWRSFAEAVESLEGEAVRHTQESNRFAARILAQKLADEVGRRWKTLGQEAEQLAASAEFRRAAAAWGASRLPAGERAAWWRGRPEQAALQAWLKTAHDRYDEAAPADNWMLTDPGGWLLARYPADGNERLIGLNWSHRDWFHGRGDEPPQKAEAQRPPVRGPYRSRCYRGGSDGRARVMFSTPVPPEPPAGDPLGVLAVSVKWQTLRAELRPFRRPAGDGDPAVEQVSAVVDHKPDWNGLPGMVMQHPFFEEVRDRFDTAVGELIAAADLPRLPPERLNAPPPREFADYADPVVRPYAKAELTELARARYGGAWLAAAEPVEVRDGPSGPALPTEFSVVVQQRRDEVFRPVDALRRRLRHEGLLAAALIVSVVLGLWAFVTLLFYESSRNFLYALLRRRAGLSARSASSGTGSQAASAGGSSPTPVKG
jgi:serine/threonine protein kinase